MDQSDQVSLESCSFEQALAALETIVRELEDGQVDLARSLARYEEGVKLLQHCYRLLTGAEQRIEILTKVNADGSAQTEDFQPEVAASAEPAPRRGRHSRRNDATTRPAPSPPAGEMDAADGLF